ncbi:hypothetical protein F5Y15DRAFT_221141 [Xylariaceae sp. FL0016]|nr:hypothetical protein F5Y15DRAFT_221141 [Xylariaceae sp. FL0016]
MASGLEILGGIAASLELVKVAKSCLSTFNDLRHADIQESDQRIVQFHFIVQGLKFDGWCSSLGIQNMFELSGMDSDKWSQTAKVKEFEELLQSELRFKNQSLAALVLSTLKSMNLKFGEAERIMIKYATSTATQPTPQTPDNTHKSSSRLSVRWPKISRKSKDRSLTPPNDVSTDDTSSMRSKFGSSMANLSWVTTDKSAAQDLFDSIKNINQSLVELLHSLQQAQINRQTDLAVLNNFDHHKLDITQSLLEGSDLRALACMKKWQMREHQESESQELSAVSGTTFGDEPGFTRPMTYSVQDFKKSTLRVGDSRSISVLNEQSVVVEWKYFSKDKPFNLEHSFRLSDLIKLLNQDDLYKKFQTLPCKGYVTDNDNSRVGMVFSIGQSTTVTAKSLQEVIYKTTAAPPVGERFLIARCLVLSLHNLLSVHWLHKGIRSDNILCFEDKAGSTANGAGKAGTLAQADPTDDYKSSPIAHRSLSRAPSPLSLFYLLGWDLSRPDHPSELSESISVSTLGFQTKRETIQMYTHPDVLPSRKMPRKRPRYHARYDIYSLGLILLEIGLWRTLDTIRFGCKSDDEFRLRVRTEYCDRLQAKMGLVYWRAVQRCLNDDFDVQKEGDSSKGDYSLQVQFEKQVVSELEKCFA